MFYLSQVLNMPVRDADGIEIGRISDLAISAGEVFPRITSVAFRGPAKTPFMISWRKYVATFSEEDGITLGTKQAGIRFSYLQPEEILLARDLLNKQIVDTQGMKVVRVNDLKLSASGDHLRLMGAEVGIRGLLRGIAPWLEHAVVGVSKVLGHPLEENLIAWSYMDLVDRDLSQVQLSMTHKRLHELHPADVADILEQLDPQQRARVFEHLDQEQAADAVAEMEDELQSDLVDDLSEKKASELLANMEPDDAADILGDLSYEKAEKLLWLMGVQDQRRIRALLGYRDKTAGGIMTTEYVSAQGEQTVEDTIKQVRSLGEEFESVHYVYVIDHEGRLMGTVSLRQLVLADGSRTLGDAAETEVVSANPDDDQEEVADTISKYNLLALPVVDEADKLLGIVTIDDALDVIEEEHEEDLAIAGANSVEIEGSVADSFAWFLRRIAWFLVWAVVAFAIILTGTADLFSGALITMPLLLVVAETVAFYVIQTLIDYDGSDGERTFPQMVGHNIAVGFIVAALIGLLLTGIGGVVVARTAFVSSMLTFTLLFTAPATLTTFILIGLSGTISALSIARHKRNKAPNDLSLTLFMMTIAIILQLAFTYAFGLLA